MTELRELAGQIEVARHHLRGLDGDIAIAFDLVPTWATKRPSPDRQPVLFSDGGPGARARTWLAPKFCSSVDDALTLIDERRWFLAALRQRREMSPHGGDHLNKGGYVAMLHRVSGDEAHQASAVSPAAALVVACLLARDSDRSGEAGKAPQAEDFPWLHRSGMARVRIVGETAEEVQLQLMSESGPGLEPPTRTMPKGDFQNLYAVDIADAPPR